MFFSNSGDPVSTCMLCASHSNSRLITGIRTHVFSKTTYHVTKGRSCDRASSSAHCMPFPSRTQVPKLRQLWWWRTRGLRQESGFPKFSKIKYLGGDSVSGKAVHVWHFLIKISFPKNDLPDLDYLVIYQSHIALCEIRFRTVT